MNEYIKGLKKTLTDLDAQIEGIQEAISIMAEAGENVTALQTTLNTLKIKRKKWLSALEAHGY